ncbi:Fe-S cluster assembly protein SufD [Pseudahrensia aquimaris]|uniref:Fe-S cluster assembly protein SufD n=1 Tax=Pseudahrensia aquimaris TaxID=744461 RepID=A0ABW3FAL4_9HYPH
MTAHTTKIFTEGETALFEAAKPHAGDTPNLAKLRELALASLKQSGLPTRRIEYFHYTDMRSLLAGKYALAEKPSVEAAKDAAKGFVRLAKDATVLHFRDGYFFDWEEDLPAGVSAEIGIPDGFELAEGAANAVEQVNTLFANGGATLKVDAGAKVERAIGLAHAHTGEENVIGAIRNRIEVGAEAECEIIDRVVGKDGVNYFSSAIVDLEIGEGATVNYILSNENGDAATRLARFNATLGKSSVLNLFILNVGGNVVRQEINFVMAGEQAELNIAGVNLVGGKAHIDVTSRIDHLVPNTNANELMRNVATGHGRGVFQGQINVAQPAQLTDAQMACNTLLLSDDCDFSAKPELEIFADDVQCAHGATVTDLEESYLFYLMARGITEERARRMLIKAFVAEAFQEMIDEPLEEALEARMDVWLDKHV